MEQKIAVLVSCHKPSKMLRTKYIMPIQVGCAFKKERFENCLYDDQFENISQKNKRYCELTAQFWAWKNIDAQSYGFFHYRRYLSLDTKYHLKQKLDCLNEKVIKKYKLNDESLEKLMDKYDVIVPHRALVWNNYNQYKNSKGHHIRDLDFCLDVIKNDYPEIYPSAQKYMKSKLAYFCNMFIMKKEIFNSYCTWLFDILEKHEKKFDCADYAPYDYRVSGFLAERLAGIYFTYLKSLKKYKFKKAQTLMFKNTDL